MAEKNSTMIRFAVKDKLENVQVAYTQLSGTNRTLDGQNSKYSTK